MDQGEILKGLYWNNWLLVQGDYLQFSVINYYLFQAVLSPRVLTYIVYRKFLGSQEILVNILV